MAKSSEEVMASMLAGLQEKTGKSIEQWIAALGKSGAQKHGERVKWLKGQGVGHGYANLITHRSLGSDAVSKTEGGEDLVAKQYTGAKAGLKPIYDLLLAKVSGFGTDVEVSPKNAYVSLRRSKQFAIVQPSTATRMDVGLNLKGVPAKGRLEDGSKWNAMCSHRVRVESVKDVDAELLAWLKQAYEKS